MPKKGRKEKSSPEGLWISPRYSLKGPAGEWAWDNRRGGPPEQRQVFGIG